MENIIEISSGEIIIQFDTSTLNLTVITPGNVWKQDNYSRARIDFNDGTVYFKDAKKISHELWKSGVGQGIVSKFEIEGFVFKTKIWINSTRHDLHFEFITLREETNSIRKVIWPGAIIMNEQNEQCYTVFPMRQGLLIPNNWSKRSEAVYEGRYYTMAYYMPWWGQVENGTGFIAIAETPWDGGCDLDHPPGGPTAMSAAWYPSLGKIGYRRIMKYSFIGNCDYNAICKSYRKHANERGDVLTLRQKILRNPKLEQLIGSNIVHEMICTHITPQSWYYNKEDPSKNDYHINFDTRAEQLKTLKQKGADKIYLHLDGWEVRGYDNLQPDVLPPCEKAGGWSGLIGLAETCHELGYLFVLHDNYTFIYNDAPSYDPDQLICDENGNVMSECVWFGGEQGFMCQHLSPYYFTRNHEQMLNEGLRLDGVYLDGFSASPLYECMHEDHI
ncbi:MAG: DUF5696 domain-containing protein, partial [Oscillospiraceae bacterium]|nr:DUF5696 domain-containing protein [Oscillospiraceae bacterium]